MQSQIIKNHFQKRVGFHKEKIIAFSISIKTLYIKKKKCSCSKISLKSMCVPQNAETLQKTPAKKGMWMREKRRI